MMVKALILSAALAAGACNKVTYVNPGTAPSGVVQSEKGWFFIFGLVGTKEINAGAMCPGGVHQIQSRNGFLDVIIAAITFSLIAPRTYEIECAAGGK